MIREEILESTKEMITEYKNNLKKEVLYNE